MKLWNLVWIVAVSVLAFPIFAASGQGGSGWLTALVTWLPVIFLIGAWVFFMRRLGWVRKGGYAQYMSVSQEKLIQIEKHLADIAESLKTIASEGRR